MVEVLLSRTKPPVEELIKGGTTTWDGQEAMECNCPPQCNELNYRFETTSGSLYRDAFSELSDLPFVIRDFVFINVNFRKYGNPENVSVFYLFFGKVYSTRYRRDLLLSWDTMLSEFEIKS